MAKFKVGDKFRAKGDIGNSFRLADAPFFTGGETYEIGFIRGEDSYALTDNEERDPSRAKHGADSEWLEQEFDFLSASPIRTVTRREIVPGNYGYLCYRQSAPNEVTLYIDEEPYTAADLREAARLFGELADVLEENA